MNWLKAWSRTVKKNSSLFSFVYFVSTDLEFASFFFSVVCISRHPLLSFRSIFIFVPSNYYYTISFSDCFISLNSIVTPTMFILYLNTFPNRTTSLPSSYSIWRILFLDDFVLCTTFWSCFLKNYLFCHKSFKYVSAISDESNTCICSAKNCRLTNLQFAPISYSVSFFRRCLALPKPSVPPIGRS